MNQLCGKFLSDESAYLPQPPKLVETGGRHLGDVLLHAELRVEYDSKVPNTSFGWITLVPLATVQSMLAS